MTNPRTVDRADVAHPTNPIGGNAHVEEVDASLAESLDAEAAKLPAGGNESTATGLAPASHPEVPDVGMPGELPPARTGKAGRNGHAPESDGRRSRRIEDGGDDGDTAIRMHSPRPGS